jgi:hypothetical protein
MRLESEGSLWSRKLNAILFAMPANEHDTTIDFRGGLYRQNIGRLNRSLDSVNEVTNDLVSQPDPPCEFLSCNASSRAVRQGASLPVHYNAFLGVKSAILNVCSATLSRLKRFHSKKH